VLLLGRAEDYLLKGVDHCGTSVGAALCRRATKPCLKSSSLCAGAKSADVDKLRRDIAGWAESPREGAASTAYVVVRPYTSVRSQPD